MKVFDGVGTGTSNELVKLGGDGNEIQVGQLLILP